MPGKHPSFAGGIVRSMQRLLIQWQLRRLDEQVRHILAARQAALAHLNAILAHRRAAASRLPPSPALPAPPVRSRAAENPAPGQR